MVAAKHTPGLSGQMPCLSAGKSDDKIANREDGFVFFLSAEEEGKKGKKEGQEREVQGPVELNIRGVDTAR